MDDRILEVRNLEKVFRDRRGKRGKIKEEAAVKGVSFQISRGECLGLIGESGSGKSTTAHMIAGLLKPTGGEIFFFGAHMQMVFQDAMKSMNPRRKVLDNICEGLIYQRGGRTREEIREEALKTMDLVRLDRKYADRLGRDLSGGECQRAAIARALLIRPELLICDEITSALDVSVQAQIIALLEELKEQLGLSLLFISHDIALVGGFCDRVAVMYRGEITEMGKTREVMEHPQKPYTKKLIRSVLTL